MADDTTARGQIFGSIRKALGAPDDDGARESTVDARIEGRSRNLIPARTAIPHDAQVDLFVEKAEGVSATVARVASLAEVPDAVADWLASHNLPSTVKVAPSAELDGVPWDRRPTLEIARGKAEDPDLSSVTPALAAVAESGTLMLTSGAGTPTTLNFMPDNHIVVLRKSQVVGTYEDGWDRVRDQGAPPRTVNFVTGPSRTGDIEQRIQLGAHGPRRLHIVIVDGADA
ncbi:MAG: lactate utilization protein [Azospirillaceae bacterium]